MAGVPLVQAELLVQWADAPDDALAIAKDDADLTQGVIASAILGPATYLSALLSLTPSLYWRLGDSGSGFATITPRGTPTTASGSTGSTAVTLPAGVVAGDVLVFNVVCSGAGRTITTPAGLTLVDFQSATGPTAGTYIRVCDGTEGASITFSTSLQAVAISCRAYSGVDNTTPVNAHSLVHSSGVSAPATAVTTTAANCRIVYGCAASGTTGLTFTDPAGYANDVQVETTVGAENCDITQAAAGTTGTPTGTWNSTGTSNWVSLIALQPAIAPAGTAADASDNGRTGSIGAGVTLGQAGALAGDSDTAALFNDTASAVIASAYSPFALLSKRTFMGWAKRTATTDPDTVFSDAANSVGLTLVSGANNVNWSPRGGSNVTWDGAWPGTGTFLHWALTYDDATKTAELFINGVSQGKQAVSNGYATGATTFRASSSSAGPFNGVLDEMAVFERLLTADEILALYEIGTGVSFISDPHVLVESDFTASFGGPYDDLSSLLLSGSIKAGRNDQLTQMQAATAIFTVRDSTGIFNVANPASPVADTIADRLHPIRFRLASATGWRTRFWGFTDRITWQPQGSRKGVAVIECVDLFFQLSRIKPTIASTGQTTTGAAIGLILDAVGWPSDPGARDLDVGDTIPDFSADGTIDGLTLIGNLLNAERGVFFIRLDGVPVYNDRYARFLSRSSSTVVDRMTGLQPQVDFTLVQNRVTVVRTDSAGTVLYATVASDPDSISRIGESDFSTVSTPYLASNAAADELAAWILGIVDAPTPPLRALVVDGRDADLLDMILDRGLEDRITVQEDSGGTLGDFLIEQLNITVGGPGRVAASYSLSQVSTDLFVLFISDADADLAYGTIALDDDQTGSGVLAF